MILHHEQKVKEKNYRSNLKVFFSINKYGYKKVNSQHKFLNKPNCVKAIMTMIFATRERNLM